jgi:starch synthase (maltosyl-transferring)
LINRIPVADISPVVYFGGEFLPVKAIAGEVIPVSATIFREGHDLLGAQVILFDAQGCEIQRNIMVEKWHGGDQYQGSVKIPVQGDFTYAIESYDHPFATWIHDSEIKIPADIDAELMCTIGKIIFEEKLAEDSSAKSLLTPAIKVLTDSSIAFHKPQQKKFAATLKLIPFAD